MTRLVRILPAVLGVGAATALVGPAPSRRCETLCRTRSPASFLAAATQFILQTVAERVVAAVNDGHQGVLDL